MAQPPRKKLARTLMSLPDTNKDWLIDWLINIVKVQPYVCTVRVRYFAVRCRTLTSLYDENKL